MIFTPGYFADFISDVKFAFTMNIWRFLGIGAIAAFFNRLFAGSSGSRPWNPNDLGACDIWEKERLLMQDPETRKFRLASQSSDSFGPSSQSSGWQPTGKYDSTYRSQSLQESLEDRRAELEECLESFAEDSDEYDEIMDEIDEIDDRLDYLDDPSCGYGDYDSGDYDDCDDSDCDW